MISLSHTPTSRQSMAQTLPTLFLLGGLLLSVCFAGIVYLAQSVATRSHDLRREMNRRSRMAQKLDSLNRNLERRVQERTEALSTANQALEEFTFMASHDLQEPLRKQRMFVGVLRHALDNVNLDERGRLAIEAIASASGRMERLVRDLLDLSRTQRHAFTRRSVSMEKLASQAIELLQDRASECNASIEKLPLPAAMGDPTLIAQLYQNLLSNALKFRDAARPLHIRLAAEQRDGLVVYTVEDNGIGVEAELSSTIFAPFKRGHSRHDFDGSGIGLAVCKRIIEHHEGQIWVESEAGKGSRFCFTLQAGRVRERLWQLKEAAHA
jgi:light-regulated signal transduction histidine kinase (bacteriophytochrome)